MPLATIQQIISINPIPNADQIEVAKVLGWDVVVAKKDNLRPGDLCIYVEIDSLIPNKEWSKFLFKEGHENDEYYRLRTIKLRKQISQGLVLPLDIILKDKPLDESYDQCSSCGIKIDYGNYVKINNFILCGDKEHCKYHNNCKDRFKEGSDITYLLDIKKYEKAIPEQLRGTVKGNFPYFLHKTDEIRIQSRPELLEELKGKPYYITTKMDGTSATFFKYKGKFGVCSRNLELKDPRTPKGFIALWKRRINKWLGKTKKEVPDMSVYWRMVEKYNLDKVIPEGYAIQGEICGPGIQGNKMGLNEIKLFVFSLFDINKQIYINPFSFGSLVLQHLKEYPNNFTKFVPLIHEGESFNHTLDGLLGIANVLDYDNDTPAEGIVVRSLNQTISFKVVSNRFLLKYGE